MPKISLTLVLYLLVFGAGYKTASYFYQAKENKALVSVIKQNTITTDKEHTLAAATNAAQTDYQTGVQDDTLRITQLLNTLNSSMQHTTSNSATPVKAISDSTRAETDSNTRLHRQLSEALRQYGSEAARANNITRRLNECIVILKQERQ